MNNENKKYIFIELTRIIACIFVIINHENSKIFLFTDNDKYWFLSITIFFISKAAVPLFLMISGYLLLDKIDTFKKSLKRVTQMIACLLVFSMVYYLFSLAFNNTMDEFSIFNFINIINKPITHSYWYLYTYIGLLIILPFAQRLTANLNDKELIGLIVLILTFSAVYPIVNHFIPSIELSEFFPIGIFNSYFALMLIGHLFKRLREKEKYALKRNMVISIAVYLISLALSILFTIREMKLRPDDYLFFDNKSYIIIILNAISLFYILSLLKFKGFISASISYIGSLTFGIYLFNDIFNEIFDVYVWNLWSSHNQFVLVFIEITLTLVCGAIVTAILRYVPIFRKFLR